MSGSEAAGVSVAGRRPPEAEWRIEDRYIDAETAEKDAEVCSILGGTPTPEGWVRVLYRGDVVWMTDSATELADHDEVLRQVQDRGGRILVHGLGLGCILRQMLIFPQVEHIDVVELEPEIIRLVAPGLQEFVDAGRLTIHEGSAFTKAWPLGTRWTVVWHDIWPDIGTESREEARQLERRFAGFCDWQTSWD